MKPRRSVVVALVAAAALAAAAWFGDLASAIPLDVAAHRTDEPLLQPPSAALRVVERALLLRGGLPHDARLTEFSAFMGMATVAGYDLVYQPRNTVGAADRIMAHVDADTVRTCSDGEPIDDIYGPQRCARYRVAFPLRVSWLHREWRPRAVRAPARWLSRWTGRMIARPLSVESGCAHHDETAMRRVVGAHWDFLRLKGRFDPQVLWEPTAAAALAGGGGVLSWSAPYPIVRFEPWRPGSIDHIALRKAIVLDGPVGGRSERLVLIKFVVTDEMRREAAFRVEQMRRDPTLRRAMAMPDVDSRLRRAAAVRDVDAVVSSDDEPVCSPFTGLAAAPPAVPASSWAHIVHVISVRADDESRWLGRRRGSAALPPGLTTVIATNRQPGGTSTVDVETTEGNVRWRGRYTIDEREPAIRDAEYTLVSGPR